MCGIINSQHCDYCLENMHLGLTEAPKLSSVVLQHFNRDLSSLLQDAVTQVKELRDYIYELESNKYARFGLIVSIDGFVTYADKKSLDVLEVSENELLLRHLKDAKQMTGGFKKIYLTSILQDVRAGDDIAPWSSKSGEAYLVRWQYREFHVVKKRIRISLLSRVDAKIYSFPDRTQRSSVSV